MKVKASLLFALLLLATPLQAKTAKTYGSLVVSEVVKVIDGDTIKVNIDTVHPLIGEAISVRLAGIDTPELSSKDPPIQSLALRAKAFTEEALKGAHTIVLIDMRRDKYFRILADVLIDGESLSEKLIGARLALPYHGREKPDWKERGSWTK